MTFHDGTEAIATVVGTDAKADVAVIKVDNTSYPPLPRGDSSKLKVGELVMAVGSPFELSQTVTTGIISATERNDVGINEYESFLQTDAPINPGNSGGPLVNMSGEVIGVNSAIVTGGRGNDGIGFAIPIDMAAERGRPADQGRQGPPGPDRHQARHPLTPALAKQLGLEPGTKGVLVDEVVTGQPGRQGGPQAGRRDRRLRRREGPQHPVVPAEGGRQRRRQVVRDRLLPRGQAATTTITPAPAEKVVFDNEREHRPGEASRSRPSRPRPRSTISASKSSR